MPLLQGLKIEKAVSADLTSLGELLRQNALPDDGLNERLDTTLVARQDGKVSGSAALEVYGEVALLRSVVIGEEVRGKGIGVALVDETLKMARRNGIKQVYLLTETAKNYFPRFGFVKIGRESVNPAVMQSAEFTHLCPVSAQVMVLEL